MGDALAQLFLVTPTDVIACVRTSGSEAACIPRSLSLDATCDLRSLRAHAGSVPQLVSQVLIGYRRLYNQHQSINILEHAAAPPRCDVPEKSARHKLRRTTLHFCPVHVPPPPPLSMSLRLSIHCVCVRCTVLPYRRAVEPDIPPDRARVSDTCDDSDSAARDSRACHGHTGAPHMGRLTHHNTPGPVGRPRRNSVGHAVIASVEAGGNRNGARSRHMLVPTR
jgi:hypothetical protein